MSRLLMTGGTGSVGPTLLSRLLERNWTVVLAGRTRPALSHPKLEFRGVDLVRAGAVEGLAEGCAAVLHLANLSKSDPAGDLGACEALAAEARTRGVPHFFYASSIRVYGAAYGRVDEGAPPRPAPGDTYAEAKVRAEERLRALLEGSGVNLRVLRLGHVLSTESAAKAPSTLSLPYLLMWGRSYPHYIEAEDAAEAIAFLLDRRGTLKHGIYNITRELERAATYNDLYGGALSRVLAAPRLVPHLLYRARPEGRGTRAAVIAARNLADEGF
jgi:nucleoside-diphosphate-sugar epimerase